MIAEPTDGSLYEVFRGIPDPRHRRGTVYPLASVLTLVSAAMLCGARSLAAISQWGRDYNHVTLQPAAVAAPGRGGSLPDSREVRTAFRTAETGLWPRCLSVRKTLISTAWVSAPVSLPLA
jgi:hypothetical protein